MEERLEPFQQDKLAEPIMVTPDSINEAFFQEAVEIVQASDTPEIDLNAPLYYDNETQTLYASGKPIKLTEAELRIFKVLVEAPGFHMPRAGLFDIPSDPAGSANRLRSHLYNLTNKLKRAGVGWALTANDETISLHNLTTSTLRGIPITPELTLLSNGSLRINQPEAMGSALLNHREQELLLYLLERGGNLASFREIRRALFGTDLRDQSDQDRIVAIATTLRNKMNVLGYGGLLERIPGVGYRLTR